MNPWIFKNNFSSEMEAFEKHLPRAVQMAQLIVQARLRAGDVAVDATVGNGHDTVFLAKLVGEEGQVIGFDIQESAISTTREKLVNFPGLELFHAGHEQAKDYLTQTPKAVMFNLGYLPGADKDVVTKSETTIEALKHFTGCLIKHGVITIVLYTGHEGGPEEAGAIREWCSVLDQLTFTVIEYGFMNQRNSPPSLIVIERK
jgi:tRNA A58 N-methylase Trm61